MNMTNDLIQRAYQIAEVFAEIVRDDAAADQAFVSGKSDISRKYQERLTCLADWKSRQLELASARAQSAQINIRSAQDALARTQNRLPDKYRWLSVDARRCLPVRPDFGALEELLDRINNSRTIGGFFRRVVGGDTSVEELVRDYWERIAAGKAFLLAEEKKNADYLAHENAVTNAEYDKGKATAEREQKAQLLQNDLAYDRTEDELRKRLQAAVDAPSLSRFEADVVALLEELAAFDEAWASYEPSSCCPEQLMIGKTVLPCRFPSPADQMVHKKMPSTFDPARGFHIPVMVNCSRPMKLLINYDGRCKSMVMEGIQSIIMKWLRAMPPYSCSLTYIDPNDRGSNLGQLQKLEETAAWDICKVYASREDIARRLKELEKFVDQTCFQLSGVSSASEFNKTNEPMIIQHLVVINDFPEKMDHCAEESLEVVMNNADKCGISMIFTKEGALSELPVAVRESFLRIDAMVNSCTIPLEGKVYDFEFDKVCPACKEFLDRVKKAYEAGLQVDNRFASVFPTAPAAWRDSTKGLMIPFALDSRGHLVELELGTPLSAHAMLTGSTGSGKSATLLTLITSIIRSYHPSDVELWLADYAKVTFAEFLHNRPPHIRLLGLECSTEFTFGLLKKVDEECLRRRELFAREDVKDIKEYREKFGPRSLQRIILFVDEFHILVQAVQEAPEYAMILENMLCVYRKYGLACVFSDQAITGLRGLTDKGKDQLQARLAMANNGIAVKETLALPADFYDDALKHKISYMSSGDVIFKRNIRTGTGEPRIILDRYRAVYVNKEERIENTACAWRRLPGYVKPDVLIADAQGRKHFDLDAVLKFEKTNGGPTASRVPLYIGTPANLEPCFCISLKRQLDENMMLIGADTEKRASIVLYAINSFTRRSDCEAVILADSQDELYVQFREELESLADERTHLITTTEQVCTYVNGLLEKAKGGQLPKVLLVWLGIESICSDLEAFPEKLVGRTSGADKKRELLDLMDQIDTAVAEFENRNTPSENARKPEADTMVYDARADIEALLRSGSRFSVHSLVTFSSVKLLRRTHCVKPECFGHRIAFSMSRDDWSSYLERTRYIGLPEDSAVYDDGGSVTRIFRPYLF